MPRTRLEGELHRLREAAEVVLAVYPPTLDTTPGIGPLSRLRAALAPADHNQEEEQ